MAHIPFLNGTATLHCGDSRDVLAHFPESSIDAVVCDPPYGLDFMGKAWDSLDGAAFSADFWRLVLRALKPGGHLLAFGGSRTYHRLAVAVEDAGFEIRDCIMWVYGTGFPKSLDVSKAIDKAAGAEREVISERATGWKGTLGGKAAMSGLSGEDVRRVTAPATAAAAEWAGWGTALKPAYEPILVARKPLDGTVAANVLAHGVGGLNIDGCRVPGSKPDTTRGAGGQNGRFSSIAAQDRIEDDGAGRFPANIIHDGSDEVLALFPADRGARAPVTGNEPSAASNGDITNARARVAGAYHSDSGSAARFYYCAKATKRERVGSKHPTVKPIALMRYLVRLVTPPRGVVLDPFAGTGTTGEAAHHEGVRFVLIERSQEYQHDIHRRMLKLQGVEGLW